MIQNKIASDPLQRHTQRPVTPARSLGFLLGLGIAGSVLTFCSRANAIETVKLVYENNDVVVSLDQIKEFAATGQPPAQIQQFLLDNG
ncbi:MAG TPA: hypothetical protein V6C57_06535, partial [Coleofasciculaceae cyanobacterium]